MSEDDEKVISGLRAMVGTQAREIENLKTAIREARPHVRYKAEHPFTHELLTADAAAWLTKWGHI